MVEKLYGSFDDILEAIRSNDVSSLSKLNEKCGGILNVEGAIYFSVSFIKMSVEFGHLKTLIYLHQLYQQHNLSEIDSIESRFFMCDICYKAAEKGHFSCLHYLINNHFPVYKRFYVYQNAFIHSTSSVMYILCMIFLEKNGVSLIFCDGFISESEFRREIQKIKRACKIIEKYAVRKKADILIDFYKKELIEETWHPTKMVHCLDDIEKNEWREDGLVI